MMVKPRPNQPILRYAVFKRDGGVCSSCGFDTEALRVQLLALPYQEREMERRQLGIAVGRTSYWDAHHVVALAEGGTDQLNNVVTLCFRCHLIETKALMHGLAAKRHTTQNPSNELAEVYG